MNIKENRTTKIYLCLDVKTRQGFTSRKTLTNFQKTWNLELKTFAKRYSSPLPDRAAKQKVQE
jgi:hypothetical protein